jgi:DNA-binding CsgD family transcriptional regulator
MLSEREQQILLLVAEGLSNRQIAGQLDISENTVKVHVRNIFAKINVSSRTEASLYAVRQGFISVPPLPPAAGSEVPEAEELLPTLIGEQTTDPSQPTMPLQPKRRSLRWDVVFVAGAVIAVTVGYSYWRTQQIIPVPTVATPNVSRWEALPALPEPRAQVVIAVADGELYAMGGGESDAQQHRVDRYDRSAQRWVAAQELPFALPRGYAWSDGSGVWLARAQAGADVQHWDGVQWKSVTNLPQDVNPAQIVRWQGQCVLLGTTGAGVTVWVYADTWQPLATLPGGVSPVTLVVNADRLMAVSAAGDVYEYRTTSRDWQMDGSLGKRWDGSVAASVLGAVLVVRPGSPATMRAYSVGQGVIGDEVLPAYVKGGAQLVPWQMQLVLSDESGTHIAMYQALYQNFAPIAQ